jgi:S1-C subfamily serine protease
MIQINAPIKPGDSGGPLLNSSGQAIGMDTAASGGRRLDQTGAVEAFAIPINAALSVASAIVKSPSGYQTATPGGFLGVQVLDSIAPPGAVVEGTQAGSPAASSGLVKGDVITGVGGATVTSVASLEQILKLHHPRDNVIVAWVTPTGQDGEATVTLATPPPAPPQ